MNNTKWTAKELETLVTLYKAGVPYDAMGDILDRSPKACQVRISVLGVGKGQAKVQRHDLMRKAKSKTPTPPKVAKAKAKPKAKRVVAQKPWWKRLLGV